MRRLVLLMLITMILPMGLMFAQDTDAPDQDEVDVEVTVTVNPVPNTNTNVYVSPEREIIAASGVVYSYRNVDYVSPDVKFLIQAKDEGSGVRAIYVMLDNNEFGLYKAPISFASEGNHMIAYRIEDNVGNLSPFKFYQFVVDTTAPEMNLSVRNRPFKKVDINYIGVSNYRFEIFAADELSGVASINYILNDNGDTNRYTAPFTVDLPNGLHKLTYFATDNVGNVASNSFTFFMDKKAPTASFVIKPAPFETNDIKYISSKTYIAMQASDEATGVSRILYSIDGGEYVEYTNPFRLTSGSHTIMGKAIDFVGNVSDPISVTLTVDNVVPDVEIVPTK